MPYDHTKAAPAFPFKALPVWLKPLIPCIRRVIRNGRLTRNNRRRRGLSR